MKIVFIVPYPRGESPSQRFRFEQYLPLLNDRNINYDFFPFFESSEWKLFYHSGKVIFKYAALARGFGRRFKLLFQLQKYSFLFIHREAAPLGPPVFEWVAKHILRKKIIYDFDDAIWTTDRVDENVLLKILKWRGKVAQICKWSYVVSCGNHYLTQYAAQFNKNVRYNPTTIDLTHHNYQKSHTKKECVTIGWTGSHSTLKYLEILAPALRELKLKYRDVLFRVIADKRPDLSLPFLEFVPWSIQTEIEDLMTFDIGVMPLPDDEWSRGKCGFKALQYMALAIPCVASPVGVNCQIIQSGVNGLLCTTTFEWVQALSKLIENPNLRTSLGRAGLKTVQTSFSVSANASIFFSLLNDNPAGLVRSNKRA